MAKSPYYERNLAGYRQAFRDASDWLARYFYPWRVMVRFHDEMNNLRLWVDTQGHER